MLVPIIRTPTKRGVQCLVGFGVGLEALGAKVRDLFEGDIGVVPDTEAYIHIRTYRGI